MGSNLQINDRKAEDCVQLCNSASKQLISNHEELVAKLSKVAEQSQSQALANQLEILKTSVKNKVEDCAKALKTIANTVEEAVQDVKDFDK